jgi:hypothetical protein
MVHILPPPPLSPSPLLYSHTLVSHLRVQHGGPNPEGTLRAHILREGVRDVSGEEGVVEPEGGRRGVALGVWSVWC